MQAETAAAELADLHKHWGDWVSALNAYNSGQGTTGHDYGPDVLERRDYLAKEKKRMELWHPRATRVTPADGHTGLSFIGVPWKIVLHTTETDSYTPDRSSYYGNPYWPHATILPGTIYQHLPINVGAYALAHDPGTAETNRANTIQCEIVWRAANPDWPDDLLATVADWISWVQSQTGVPTEFAEMWRAGVVLASVDSPIRFSDEEGPGLCIILGHSNMWGGNDHWDPGRLPVDRLRALLDPIPPPPPPPPPPPKRKEPPKMVLLNYRNAIWLVLGGRAGALNNMDQANALLAAGVPTLGDVSDELFAQLTGAG